MQNQPRQEDYITTETTRFSIATGHYPRPKRKAKKHRSLSIAAKVATVAAAIVAIIALFLR